VAKGYRVARVDLADLLLNASTGKTERRVWRYPPQANAPPIGVVGASRSTVALVVGVLAAPLGFVKHCYPPAIH
jgi:hypothetical protein